MSGQEGIGDDAPPLVSVVIPTYNGASLLGETIESVRAQTLRQWELVLYDDGSSDDTPEIARRAAATDARIRALAGTNGGVASARNSGFERTDPRSRYVAFLDQDDLWLPETLQTLVDVLDSQPRYVAAHVIASCIDEHGNQPEGDDLEASMRRRRGYRTGRLEEVGPDEPTTFADLAVSNWIVTPGTVLMRREAARRAGGFDREVTPADDWDMAVRLSRLGPIAYVDRPLLRWRRHANAQSYASPGYGRAHLRVRHKMLSDPTNTPEQLRVARNGYLGLGEETMRTAKRAFTERHVRAAVRQTAKALWQYGWYIRSEATRLVGKRR